MLQRSIFAESPDVDMPRQGPSHPTSRLPAAARQVQALKLYGHFWARQRARPHRIGCPGGRTRLPAVCFTECVVEVTRYPGINDEARTAGGRSDSGASRAGRRRRRGHCAPSRSRSSNAPSLRRSGSSPGAGANRHLRRSRNDVNCWTLVDGDLQNVPLIGDLTASGLGWTVEQHPLEAVIGEGDEPHRIPVPPSSPTCGPTTGGCSGSSVRAMSR